MLTIFPKPNNTDDKNAKKVLLSEYNISSVINQLLNRDSFVITLETPFDKTSDESFKFNLLGYYVEISWVELVKIYDALLDGKVLVSDEINEYLKFQLNDRKELVVSNKFKLVGINPDKVGYLALLTCENGSYDVPESSYLTLDIDDGELTDTVDDINKRVTMIEDKVDDFATKEDISKLSARIDKLEQSK